jgi:phospholipid/cholesterol/gamma-HCH transport system substrate-binding protein
MKRRDEVSVGIVITFSVIVLILGTLWLVRGGLKSGYPLYTRFEWGQNLKQGQPVLLAGVTVGYVGDVNLRPDGYIDVLLKVDDKFPIPKGSKATVKPIGIFGDVAVALTPPKPVPQTAYSPGDTVPPGIPSADVDQIMSRVDSIGRAASILMTAIQEQVVAAGTLKDLHRTVAGVAQLSTDLQRLIADQNRNLAETGEAFRQTATRFGNLADSAKVGQTLENFRTMSENGSRLIANLDSSNTRLKALLAKAESPNGTLGKFLGDTLLWSDVRRLLATSDSLVADIKANPRKYINFSVFGK